LNTYGENIHEELQTESYPKVVKRKGKAKKASVSPSPSN